MTNPIDQAIQEAEYTSQLEALLYLLSGRNCFISGPAGSGKSYIIQTFCSIMRMHTSKEIVITSTTGLSAVNIGGTTVHKAIGIPVTGNTYEVDCQDSDITLKWKMYTDKKLKKIDVLIIDEVSMMSERLLHYIVKRLKSIGRFHQVQFILMGDFAQLPPVCTEQGEEFQDARNFCYGTKDWKSLNLLELYLDKVFRTGDKQLIDILDNITDGNGLRNPKVKELLNRLPRTKSDFLPGSTLLLTTNAAVDKINQERQRLNPSPIVEFPTLYGKRGVEYDKASEDDLKYAKSINIPSKLVLKDGDTIMVTNNQVDCKKKGALVNGTIGIFRTSQETPVSIEVDNVVYKIESPMTYSLEKEKTVKGAKTKVPVAFVTQYPIRLAYAITIHKSQGQTFSHVTMNLNNCWCENLGYVALSRAKGLEGIKLIENHYGSIYNSTALEVNDTSIQIRKTIRENAKQARIDNQFQIKTLYNYYKKWLASSGFLQAEVEEPVKIPTQTNIPKSTLDKARTICLQIISSTTEKEFLDAVKRLNHFTAKTFKQDDI